MKKQQGSALFSAIVAAPFGAMGVRAQDAQLCELVYLPPHFAEKAPLDIVSERACVQLARYFLDPDYVFDLPLTARGSTYQQRVWAAIVAIPRGQVRTYGEVARLIGSSPRAVGQACGANWFPVLIACHRVTAAGGLGGFAHHDDATGFHLGVKRWLLAHEGAMGMGWSTQ